MAIMPDLNQRLLADMEEAERKAWDALARYKFQMFGYWAAIWVHLNRVGQFKRDNPWRLLVRHARACQTEGEPVAQEGLF